MNTSGSWPQRIGNGKVNRHQTALGLLGYLFIGTAAVLIPSVMPFITEEYMATGLSLAAIGLIFPARSVGGILGNLLAGVGSDRYGRNTLVWISALALAASLALTAAAQLWLLFVVGFVLISTAQAFLTTAINALIADANRAARARALNVLHGVYGVGATISPLVIGLTLEWGLPWRWALAATGLIWLIYGGGTFLLQGPVSHRSQATGYHTDEQAAEGRKKRGLDWSMLRNTGFLGLFLVAFIYNGVAYSLLGWIALFMQESAGLSTFFSVSTIAIFYVALTAGRFVCAAFAERLGYAVTLLILAVGITLTYPLVVFSTEPTLVMVGVFLTGLSLSGLFPTALAYGSRLYPAQTGTVSGTLNAALTTGAMLPPLWTGVFADLWSFQVALGVNYWLVLLLLAVCLFLGRKANDSGQ